MNKPLDLGDDHALTFCNYEGEERVAANVWHKKPDGSECVGFIPFEGRAWANAFHGKIDTWRVEQDEPLTLSPSLLCRACGDHGFVRDGKWVRA